MFNRFIQFCSNLGECVISVIESTLNSLLIYIVNYRHRILEGSAVFMLCINPFMAILAYSLHGKVGGVVVAVSILLLAICICVIDVSIKEVKAKKRKRLTHMNRYGDIEIQESDLQEAIRLLYEIENEMGVK